MSAAAIAPVTHPRLPGARHPWRAARSRSRRHRGSYLPDRVLVFVRYRRGEAAARLGSTHGHPDLARLRRRSDVELLSVALIG